MKGEEGELFVTLESPTLTTKIAPTALYRLNTLHTVYVPIVFGLGISGSSGLGFWSRVCLFGGAEHGVSPVVQGSGTCSGCAKITTKDTKITTKDKSHSVMNIKSEFVWCRDSEPVQAAPVEPIDGDHPHHGPRQQAS